jgi:tetratricopeptide (TPR) repeat protein
MAMNSAELSEARVHEILEEYLAERQAGRTPDRAALLARHPDLAESLAASLRALDFVHEAGHGFEAADALPDSEEPAATGGVLGDFRLQRKIARGGMAVVYEAEQISLGRRVALKVLPFAAILDARQGQRFKNEAQAAAQLQHPHIVPVYAVGCDRGMHYYAMQYVDGQSLAVAIRELREGGTGTPPITPITSHGSTRELRYIRMAAELGARAAEALDYAHQVGIVHRDVKPGNLLVDRSGTLWVADFGLASSRRDVGLTMTGELLGTARYMSPEQAQAQKVPVDHRTDVYSLGATLYELLTLEPAFPGENMHRVLQDIETKEPLPPRQINPSIPHDLETVLLKAMSKDPAGRYATAREMANDLVRFLENRPVEATRPGLLKRATKWGRRHRALVGSAAAVLVLAVAALATGTALLWREKENTQAALGRAKGNLILAFQALDEIYLDEAAALPTLQNKLAGDPDRLQKGLGFYKKFATDNAQYKDVGWLVGDAYIRASSILLAQGKTDEAHETLEQAISTCREATHQTDPARAHVSLGNALWIKDDLDGAIAEYRKAIALEPDYAGAHHNLGIALLKTGALDEAIREYRTAIALNPADANAHNELGMALRIQDKLDEAIEHYTEALRLNPKHAYAHSNLGNALHDKKDFVGAIREHQAAIKLQPSLPNAHINLGNAFRAKGDLPAAKLAYEKAIDLQPTSFLAHYALSRVLRDVGDPAGELREYREAMRVRPNDPLAHLMNCHVLSASVRLEVGVPIRRSPAATGHRVHFEGYNDVSDFPTAEGIRAILQFDGTSPQLGDFSFRMPHDVDVVHATAKGTFELVAANGDRLFGTMTGILTPSPIATDPKRIVETATIKGGTGRFAAVTGGFTIERLLDRASGWTVGTHDIPMP